MDLHLHTHHSDGTMTVEQIVNLAKEKNIELIAITDHDTVSGVKEAQEIGAQIGVKVIPGIEINTEYKKREVHILGYFIDIHNEELSRTISLLREGRVGRVKRIISKLNSLDIDITFDDVLKEGKGESIGRPHVALAMIKKGYGDSVSEIFDNYLEIGKPAYVERFKLSPFDAVKLVQQSGGIAVLAHPKLVWDEQIVEELLPHLDGLEVYHSEHEEDDITLYLEKAHIHNLIITGGSDCHGDGKSKKALLGTVTVPLEYTETLLEIYREKSKDRRG